MLELLRKLFHGAHGVAHHVAGDFHLDFESIHVVLGVEHNLVVRERLLCAEECRFDLAREHVHAMDDEHVVGARGDAVHDAHGATAMRTGAGAQPREVAGTIAHHRRAEAVERGEHEFALFAVGKGLERFGVDDFGIVVVFPDVETATTAVAGDARTRNLGESVDVVGDDARFPFDRLAHRIRPGFGAEDAVAQFRVAAEVDAELLRDFDDVEEVGGRAGDRGGAEVAHEHQLLFRIAGRSGQHGAAEVLAAVVEAEAAGEESIAVGNLEHVLVGESVHREAARGGVGPDFDVALAVGNADRLARRSRGAVEAHDFGHRRGGEPGGVFIAQIGLLHEGELREVGERHEVARFDARFVAAAAEERHALVFVGDESLEFRELQRAKFLDGHVVLGGNRIVHGFKMPQ